MKRELTPEQIKRFTERSTRSSFTLEFCTKDACCPLPWHTHVKLCLHEEDEE